jgi:hypothetical protein
MALVGLYAQPKAHTGQESLPHSSIAPNIEADQPAGLSKWFNNQRACLLHKNNI